MIFSSDRAGFLSAVGHLFEHSPWVAEAAWAHRPFTDEAALHAALMRAVDEAPAERQLALIRAHPELGAKVALTAASDAEQQGAGLRTLSAVEYDRFTALNAAYRQKFGFPFIVCVRNHTRSGILAAFEARLANGPAAERTAALREIGEITRLRLGDLALDSAA